MDLSHTIAPKSDQTNADDLIAGAITITVSRVSESGSPDQPVTINYEGDNGRPYKPCKSMRRALIACWGADGKQWIGRSMTLFCDPQVKFGGAAVGGIRISHLSHIEKDMELMLTVTRAKRAPYKIKRLQQAAQQQAAMAKPEYPAADFAANMAAFTKSVQDGKSTPKQIIAYLEKTNTLTQEQREFIEGLKNEQ